MTPNDSKYFGRLQFRVDEIVEQGQLQLLVQDLKAMNKNPKEIDTEVFFALIHEGYRQRCMEEKFWENADWDYQI